MTLTWSPGTFPTAGTLTATPLTLAADVDGFSRASKLVAVTFAPAGAAAGAVTFLPSPLSVAFAGVATTVLPSYSVDGVAWTPLTALPGPSLPAGRVDGWHRSGATLTVYTRHTGFFALLVDISPPSRPAAVVASLVRGGAALRLGWPPSADNSRRIRAYQVLLGGKVVASVPGSRASAVVGLARLTRTARFTVRAVDEAGNASRVSRAVVVRVRPRPRGVPARIPSWAPRLRLWQTTPASVRGPRPAAPSPLPSWYRAWSRWIGTRISLHP
ncbi:MAG: hypothetical protein IRZ04_19525 [Rhodospirillales bacterium]|nr:hypothetical protein [Rhodospirillales bacterium]